MTRVINMWASPRNVSTAMMYAWAQRADTTVWDEPMYGNYLVVTSIDHPMRDEILAEVPTDADEIIARMLHGDWTTPLVFYKNMAKHLVGFDISVVDGMENFLLTRDPAEMLPSLRKGLGRTPDMGDTGYDIQVEILERILGSGRTPVVVDSAAVVTDPEGTLRALCEALDIGFDDAMLSWPAGPKPYDGVWGTHWYTRLHTTTGFEQPRGDPPSLTADLIPLYEACAPLYQRLTEFAVGGSRG